MPDLMDQAQALEERQRGAALERLRNTSRTDASASTGECADCGDTISPERLKALPTAERCLPCQARRERSRR